MRPLFSRAVALAVSLLSGVLFVAAPAPSFAEVPRRLTVGLDRDMAPFSFVTPEGRIDGLVPEMLALVFRQANLTLDIVGGDFDELSRLLQSGRVDAMMRADVMLSNPDTSVETHGLVEFATSLFLREGAGLSDLRDLDGRRVGVRRNGPAGALAAAWVRGMRAHPVEAASFGDAFRLLAAGEVDAALAPYAVGLSAMQRLRISGITARGTPIDTRVIRVTVRADRADVVPLINRAIADARSSGAARAIEDNWLTNRQIWMSTGDIAIIAFAAIAALLGVLIMIWVASLHREVSRRGSRIAQLFADREQEIRALLDRQQRLNQIQRDFIALATHEFNTPLAVIDSAAQMLGFAARRRGAEEMLPRLDKIRAAVARLIGVMDTVLADDRLAAGPAPIRARPFDPAAAVREAVAREIDARPTLLVDLDCSGAPADHVGDREMIVLAVCNLLRNAGIHGAGAAVSVSVVGVPAGVAIAVSDRGPGIAESDRPHLFEKFYRGADAQQRPGTGIGLFLVKQVAEAHGGQIVVESRAGAGATFTLVLPSLNAAPAGAAPSGMAPPSAAAD
jgi:signal transduction histidine kinase